MKRKQYSIEVAPAIKLWVETIGEPKAPVVLLMMGANASGLAWPDDLVEGLAAHYQVIRYDHRDTGASTRAFDEKPYPLSQLAEDAMTILDYLEIDRAHVFGMSMGAILCQYLLIKHPERLCSAVLLGGTALEGTSPLPGEQVSNEIPKELLDYWSTMFNKRDEEEELDWRVTHWRLLNGGVIPFDPNEFRAMEKRIIRHANKITPSTAHAQASYDDLAMGKELVHIDVPVLIIGPTHDPISPLNNAKQLAAAIPGSKMVVIEGLGHALASFIIPKLLGTIEHFLSEIDC